MATKSVARQERPCPYTKIDPKDVYGEEVHLFLHVHLRGYDLKGEGLQMDSTYFDKYGAPVDLEKSWTEGYHDIELTLGKHFNQMLNTETEFPPVVGVAGGVHLYKPIHCVDEKTDEPWNVTGWIPLQRWWLYEGKFFNNRDFMAIRGNEIQNNLWDYHPHGEDICDEQAEQLDPIDKYRGGYYYPNNAFGRYLHVISLKSHKKDEKTKRDLKFNFIVHPLAYPLNLNSLPDNSIDAMQWCCVNIPHESHFGPESPWGEKVNAIEIFNDFTYYNSYQDKDKDLVCNGELNNISIVKYFSKKHYIYWFEPYPLQFGEFLLETSLNSGAYFLTLTCNDAFYNRERLPPETESDKQEHSEKNKNLQSDPKASTVPRRRIGSQTWGRPVAYIQGRPVPPWVDWPPVPIPVPYLTKMEIRKASLVAHHDPDVIEAFKFLRSRPYRANTAFGHTTIIDTKKELKGLLNKEDRCYGHVLLDIEERGLNAAEPRVMEFLLEGRYYSQTGVYDIFQYDLDDQVIPFVVDGQNPKSEKLCYEITTSHNLKFTFPKCKENRSELLIWRYTVVDEGNGDTLVYTHGYFKLDKSRKTVLDLSSAHAKNKVKWLYFTAFNEENPQRRAWFNTIRGPAFGQPQCEEFNPLQELTYRVVQTTMEIEPTNGQRLVKEDALFQPLEFTSGELDFTFGKCIAGDGDIIYVYSMQVNPLQQDFSLEPTKESSTVRPPRFLEMVNGYFTLNDSYETRLKLNDMWDKKTVLRNTVSFYAISAKTGQPTAIIPQPQLYTPDFEDGGGCSIC